MHLIETAIFAASIKLLYAYLALYMSLQLIQGLFNMAKAKGRHVVKCAASGQLFAGITSDSAVLSVTTDIEKAEPLADEQAATYAAAFLNRAACSGNYQWVPDFQ